MKTSRAWPEPIHVTVEEAFAAAGEIAEALYALEAFAADLDEPLFSDDVLRARQALTLVGDRLARLVNNDRRLHQTSPETNGGSGRQE